ncbi:MAG: hypothetical protein CL920_19485 [Deltaproteobacteria bacterium]|nr:hypothetical protein [Deltaproteobacteria bacterium]MBU50871.1 hypothetical protein [Deltaproteobacteria bacterium]|tara:strand:+ start:8868 stop:9530 length:663 start_codon:yes stop_codon:yes gene_type:complete
MKIHILSIYHYVEHLAETKTFLLDTLGFEQVHSTQTTTSVENGSIRVCLAQADETNAATQIFLEQPTKHIERDVLQYQKTEGFEQVQALHHVSQERAEAHFHTPYGITLILTRNFNEDELGIIPELNMNLCWSPQAESFMRSSLRLVPVVFRDVARTRCTEKAELMSVEHGDVEVDMDTAVRAFIREAPFFMHGVLREELEKTGLDMSPYEDEFERRRVT